MTDSIIWVKPETAVNLDAVAYIETKPDEGKIVFSSGAVISLDGKDSERLAKYLRGVFTVDVRMPATLGSKATQT